jgi:serine/threonine protein kinase
VFNIKSIGELQDSAVPVVNYLLRGLGLGGRWIYKIKEATIEKIESLGYRIEGEELGRGSFSIVLRARHQDSGRFVAIKVIVDANSQHTMRQYQREVLMLTSEDLPYGIAPLCFHNSQDASCQPFVILEYIDGERIHEFLSRRRLSVQQRTKIVEQLFQAYAGLHKAQWIHGDPSPNNVLVDRRGSIRVIDFGNTRRISSEGSVAVDGEECSGTPAFAPREQVAGTKPVSVASDLYGVAALSYLIYTGEKLSEEYRHDSQKLKRKLLEFGVPGWMVRIVANALRAPDVVPGLSDSRSAFYSFADVNAAIQRANRLPSYGYATLGALLLACSILATCAGIGLWWRSMAQTSMVQERRATQSAVVKQLEQTIIWLTETGHDDSDEIVSRLERERDRWRSVDLTRIEPNEMQIYQQHCLMLVQESITQVRTDCFDKPNVALIDDCIAYVPWIKASSFVMRELASVTRNAKRFSERLDAGAVAGVHEELVDLSKQMRALIRLNRRAVSAKSVWGTYHANLETISLRVRQLPEFGEVDVLDREGDAAWESGDFELAKTKYQQAMHALDLLLTRNETVAEKAARVAMVAQSDFRAVAQMRDQLNQAKLERDQLAVQLSELKEQSKLFTEYLATRLGRSSEVLVASPEECKSNAATDASVVGRGGEDETTPQWGDASTRLSLLEALIDERQRIEDKLHVTERRMRALERILEDQIRGIPLLDSDPRSSISGAPSYVAPGSPLGPPIGPSGPPCPSTLPQ